MDYKSRKDIPEQYKWDLSLIFADVDAWEKAFAEASGYAEIMSKFKGQLGDPAQLLSFFRLSDEQGEVLNRLALYCNMRSHEDLRDNFFNELCGRFDNMVAMYAASVAFANPEIIASYSEEKLLAMSESPRFADYSYALSELARNKKHVLSEREELLLSQGSVVFGRNSTTFSLFDNADVKWEDAKDKRGRKHKMSHGAYGTYLYSKDRVLRKNAHNSMMKGYKDYINTLSSVYAGNVDKDLFLARARGFDTCLEKAMNGENVDVKAYENLIEAVHNAIPTLKAYRNYRSKIMGISEARAYDMYVNTEDTSDVKYTYDEAHDLVVKALSVLGDDYVELLKRAKEERWIDVYETPGKRSGAYSWGCHTTLPYMLLNFMGTRNDVFTLAHEMGHSMHSYYSSHNQPIAKSSYEIFVAEIASTVNETLLLKYLLKDADKKTRRELLGYWLDMFKSTVFRQTLFAEFEKQAHEVVEKGGALSAGSLCAMYEKLNEEYYGKGYCTPYIKYEWARIPHFYTAYYVYKYATGLISATVIAEDIFNGKEGAVENYKKFLSAGGSMPPLEILKLTGVDLTTSAPFEQAMQVFKDTLKEFKKAK